MSFFNIKDLNYIWILSKGLKVIFIIIGAFVANFIIKTFIAKGFKKKIGKELGEKRKKRIKTLISVFEGTSKFLVSILAILIISSEFGININALLAGVGILGLAVGMASREIIADFLSGIFILIEDQYNIGDEVKIMGIEGKISEITLRKTIIKDKDGDTHMIPNGQIKIIARRHDS